jgi:hypothetical protein
MNNHLHSHLAFCRRASQRKWFVLLATLWVSIFFVSACTAPTEVPDTSGASETLPVMPAGATPTLAEEPSGSPTAAILISRQASATQDPNCTYSMQYWAQHPEAWLTDNIIIGRLTYSMQDARQILVQNNQDSTRALVLKEFFAATLNVLKGADGRVIERDMIAASDWLNRHPAYDRLTPEERAEGEALFRVLNAFNLGETGPGRCADEPVITLTTAPTGTATATATATRRPGTRPAATRTPRPTLRGPGRTSSPPSTTAPAPTAGGSTPTVGGPPPATATRPAATATARPTSTATSRPTAAPTSTPVFPTPTNPVIPTSPPPTSPPTQTPEPDPPTEEPAPPTEEPSPEPLIIIDLPLLPPIRIP